jgi:MoaA/NifB/PqqE/SkfB family radical SAM enzyme
MDIPQRFITLSVTTRCNSRCRFCITGPECVPITDLDLTEAEAYLRQNAGQGFEAASLVGGEPTLYRRLPELLELIRRTGYPMTQMFTNGRRMAKRSFAEWLVAEGVGYFVVSLHGPDPEIHNYLTGAPRAFEQAVEGIRNLKQLGQPVQILSVVLRPNVRRVPEMVDLALQLGVDSLDIAGLCPYGVAAKNFDELAVRYEEARPHIREAVVKAQEAGLEIFLEGFPFCAVRPYERLCVEYPATREEKLLCQGRDIEDYDACLNSAKTRPPQCDGCTAAHVCGGVYMGYLDAFGAGDVRPLGVFTGPPPRTAETPQPTAGCGA